MILWGQTDNQQKLDMTSLCVYVMCGWVGGGGGVINNVYIVILISVLVMKLFVRLGYVTSFLSLPLPLTM